MLRPFFSYYGGKWLKAPHYPTPKHDLIVEPFAGSAGYSVRHYQHQIHLYDLDPVICGVWNFLINATRKDIENLPTQVQLLDDVHSCQEAKSLIGFWLNPGSAVPKKTMSKWKTFEHSNSGQLYWGQRVKERIIVQLESIRHWKIEQKDFLEICDGRATWFVDPPYQSGGEHYRHSFEAEDFRKLKDMIDVLSGQIIVCERTGADWLPFKHLLTGRSAKYQFSGEAIYIKET